MQPSKTTEQLLDRIGFKYIETILDRRGTLAVRVSRDGCRAVLKLVSEDGSAETEHKARLLLNEANLLSTIPALTNSLYMAHGTQEDRCWLLTRDVDGEEIHQAAKQIRRDFADTEARVSHLVGFTRRITAFYSALFTGGYLHCDIQPAHTYLEGNQVTVIDWGLAQRIDVPNPLYKGGFIYFVAPEVAQGMQSGESIIQYTPMAEVYALAATLFMIYTGSLALNFGIPRDKLKEAPMTEKLQRVIQNRINTFEEVEADYCPALEMILQKALASDPSVRYNNPVELHRAILDLRISSATDKN